MHAVKTKAERWDSFRTQCGFIWFSIGSAEEMGNLWRFSTMVSQRDSLTVLLSYFLFVILIGSSGVLPGAQADYSYIFTLNPAGLRTRSYGFLLSTRRFSRFR